MKWCNLEFWRNLLRKNTLSITMMLGAIGAVAVAGFTSFASECERLPDKVLRLHIIADSDSEEDQRFKAQLRDQLLQEFSPVLSECDSLESAKQTGRKLLPEIERVSRDFADERNYVAEITAEITKMYFTTRVYDSFTLPAGNYTALRITIGEGAGQNWWCVMFPPLCVPAVTADSQLARNSAIDAVHIPESGGNGTQIKFALFEFLSALHQKNSRSSR